MYLTGSNKLTMNINKTHFMVSHSLMSHPPPINIIIGNLPIQQLCEVQFLGITIDSNLV